MASTGLDTLLSAATHQLYVTVLGYGQKYLGNYQKLEATREYVASMDADDLVLFVDAYVSGRLLTWTSA